MQGEPVGKYSIKLFSEQNINLTLISFIITDTYLYTYLMNTCTVPVLKILVVNYSAAFEALVQYTTRRNRLHQKNSNYQL